jgi:hypothetical protein
MIEEPDTDLAKGAWTDPKPSRLRKIRSTTVIAKLLNSEGFSDTVANAVYAYWRNRTGLTRRQRSQLSRMRSEVAALAKKLTEGEKQVLGRFIGLQKKASFDTGLRIGILAFATKQEKLFDDTTEAKNL